MLRFILLPFALIAAALFAMSAWIMANTLHHSLTWPQTSAVVVSTDMAATGNKKYGKATDLALTLRYEIGGTTLSWSGFGKDIGVYAAQPGESLMLHYNPTDPGKLDTAAMKGWRGGLLMLAVTGGLVALYVWFFWLRGGRRPLTRSAYATARQHRSSGKFGLR